ncbi:hypothetical protein ACQQ2N_17550 [Dokdonella sp. MW10]|uniref:hypothetical protein n=1 Tax=Dokdonella sp. MW10 TaxID=2992926 RepID=UPI003F7EA502
MKLGKVKDERGRVKEVPSAPGEQRGQSSGKAHAHAREYKQGKPHGAPLTGPALEAQMNARHRLITSMFIATIAIWMIVMVVYGWASGFFARVC